MLITQLLTFRQRQDMLLDVKREQALIKEQYKEQFISLSFSCTKNPKLATVCHGYLAYKS